LWYNSGTAYPQAYNMLKYFSSMLVVLYGMFRSIDAGYIVIIVVATLFKWWWDIVMDFGLNFMTFPGCLPGRLKGDQQTELFLRGSLLYKSRILYHIVVWVDLILRFVWVTSLMSSEQLNSIFGPLYTVCLGSLEIIRRSMWGLLRVEYEHLKFLEQAKIGYHVKASVPDTLSVRALRSAEGFALSVMAYSDDQIRKMSAPKQDEIPGSSSDNVMHFS
jgi:hypothetical protein